MIYRATFEKMILNSSFAKEPIGPFEVEVFDGRGLGAMNTYCKACLIPTRQKFGGRGFATATKMKDEISAMFRKQTKDWVEIKD